MSEIRSALMWERGSQGISPLTVTLQEVQLRKRKLLMALVCESEEGGKCPQQPAGIICEGMVSWFHRELLPYLEKNAEPDVDNILKLLQKQWKICSHKVTGNINISGIVLWEDSFAAFGNMPVYVLNKRFNRPRRKNLFIGKSGKEINYTVGEVGSLLTFYLGNQGMQEYVEEEELLESLYKEELMEEKKLEKRLIELGHVTVERSGGKSVGAVVLEVEP